MIEILPRTMPLKEKYKTVVSAVGLLAVGAVAAVPDFSHGKISEGIFDLGVGIVAGGVSYGFNRLMHGLTYQQQVDVSAD